MRGEWSHVIWVVAAITMILGTVVGVAQTSVKRMLAYSSIAHSGYLLLALLSANSSGKSAMLFYLATYAFTNLGAFGVIGLIEQRDADNDRLSDYAGLWHSQPTLAAFMTIFLLSLGGFPPFGGFIAKWYVFTSAIEAGQIWLAIIGVLTSVVSVFFYLRVIVQMYMTSSATPLRLQPVPVIAGTALVVSALGVLYLGVLPSQFIDWAAASIRTIF
jgi:NADH-quinone oxidoreductase subunit N